MKQSGVFGRWRFSSLATIAPREPGIVPLIVAGFFAQVTVLLFR
jgi:hypothetical protein